MKKTFFIAIIATLLLTACGESTISTTEMTDTSYATENFAINYPKDWSVLEKSNFTSNFPASTILAIRNNVKNEIFTENIVINKSTIDKKTTIEDTVKSSKENLKANLIGYKEIKSEKSDVKTTEKDVTSYKTTYQGKKTPSSPTLQFEQEIVIQNGYLYTITGAYRLDSDEMVVKMIEEMINSFSLK